MARSGSPKGNCSERNGGGSGHPLDLASLEIGRSRAREAVPQGGERCTYFNASLESMFQSEACPE